MVLVYVFWIFTGGVIVGVLWDLERDACEYTPSGAVHCLEIPRRRKYLVFSVQIYFVTRSPSAVPRGQ